MNAHLKKLLRRDRVRQMQYRRREELAARAEQWDDYRLTLEAMAHNIMLLAKSKGRRLNRSAPKADLWGAAQRSLRDNRLALTSLGRHLPESAATPTQEVSEPAQEGGSRAS